MSNEVRIAISGKSGCGNTTVSGLVAQALGVQLVNYTFRTLAQEEGLSLEEIARRAEGDPTWDYLVDRRQVELASAAPSVLGTRLAIWVWKEARLKVYLRARPETRAARIQRREGGRLEEVLEATNARDARDTARYQRLYGIDNNDVSFADLVIDTDALNAQEITDLIVNRWRQLYTGA